MSEPLTVEQKREKANAYSRKWYSQNQEKVAAYDKTGKAAYMQEYRKKYREKNREKYNTYAREYARRKRAENKGEFTNA